MFYPNLISLLITLLLLPQVFVHGGIARELRRKFLGFFKWPKPDPFYDNCNLCLFGTCTPIVWPSNNKNFDASVDAEKIMSVFTASGGLDDYRKSALANILIEKSAPQRTAIGEAFKKKYNKGIRDKLKEVMSSTWRYSRFVRPLAVPLPQFYGEQFQFCINFITRENEFRKKQAQTIIVEMLTTLPKCLLDKAFEIYNSGSNQDLIFDLDKALTNSGKSPEYREVIKKLIEQKKDPNQHASWIKAFQDAYKLRSAVIARRETEAKERFSELFTKLSIPQIFETKVVYENLRHGDKEYQSFKDDADKYLVGEKEIYDIMVRIISNKPLYFAKTLEGILKSGLTAGSYEERVIYFFAGRFDIDLKDIVVEYNQLSKTGLRADFDAWEKAPMETAFRETILKIIDNASKTP